MPATMAKPKKRDASAKAEGPAPDRHRNPSVGYRPGPAVRGILEELADKEKRTLANMVDVLVEEALAGRGLLPKKDA